MKGEERNIISISQLEQVKLSTMWAGSKIISTYQMYVLNKENNKFEIKDIKFSQNWYKLIDEIISNSIDHYHEFPKKVSYIKIDFDKKTGIVYVCNNGPSIGIKKTKNILGEEMYVAQMAASDFNSSSNYYKQKKMVSGQNGAGIKIVNAYSDFLDIDTIDSKKKKRYQQRFEKRLEVINPPVITDTDIKEDYTSIRFLPAYEVFGYKGGFDSNYGEELYQLIEMRAYHAAVFTGANVFINGEQIVLPRNKEFIEFAKMYLTTENAEIYSTKLIHDDGEPDWDICIGISDGKFQHVSIINGVNVYDGGNFIKNIQNQIVEALQPKVEKILKPVKQKFNRNMIINSLFIFVRGKMANPEFDSQIKNKIMNPIENFAKYKFRQKDWKSIWDLLGAQIEATFLNKAKLADNKKVIRGDVNVPKYEGAQMAGKPKHSSDCILWIAEGDSACGTIKEGIVHKCSKLNFKYCGTFNIGGVPMNCRTKCIEKINPKTNERTIVQNTALKNNERLSSLIKVLGLSYGKTYDGTSEEGRKEIESLRYGRVIVAVDQDADGAGIFGLILNFFEYFWPNLIKIGYISKFNTPIIRAFTVKKDGSGNVDRKSHVHEFYTMSHFKQWIQTEFNGDEERAQGKYFVKYYKGLGGHENGDIPSMFSDYEKQLLCAALDKKASETFTIFYGKDTDARKVVLRTPPSELPLQNPIDVSDILHSSVKEFHRDKIARSLPHVVDGLTESRRKVLWSARHKFGKTTSVKNQIKVAALAAYTTQLTAYMHGEQCLADTIILMAQTFPGSNHLPMLMPRGHFGSRAYGGKDAASPRYIFTQLNSSLCYAMFPEEDDYLLEFVFDEGQRCEPKFMVPILPMAILEHLQGNIGVGWSSQIWARDLMSVFKNVRAMIKGKQKRCFPMKTWLHENKGEIRISEGNEYSVGQYEYDSKKNIIHINELPLGMYPRNFLGSDKEKSKPSEDAKNTRQPLWARPEFEKKPLCETSKDINITLYIKSGEYEKIVSKYGNTDFDPIEDFLGLKTRLNSNINCIGADDTVLEFKCYENVVDTWFIERKNLYKLRIERQLILLKLQILYLENIIRFMDNESNYGFTTKTELDKMKAILESEKYNKINETLLKSPKYTPISELEKLILFSTSATYTYLLTLNNIDKSAGNSKKRKEQLHSKKKELEELKKSIKDDTFPGATLWTQELNYLETIIMNGFKTNWGLE
jgi:DNA topoisomerase-2